MGALQPHVFKTDGRPWRPFSSAINDRGIQWLWLMAVLAGVIFPLTKSLVGMQSGDGILPALMSTQKLTWYFWGQDRFLNFLPALAKPFSNIEWNLRFQLFLRAFFAFLAPVGIIYFFNQSAKFVAFATAITNLILSLTTSQLAIFNIYLEENPFCTSLVLFAFSLYAIRQNERRLVWLIISLLFGFIAYATNMALLVIAFPLILLSIVFGLMPRWRLFIFLVVNILSVWLAIAHARHHGEGQTPFNQVNITSAAVRAGYESVIANVSWVILLLMGLLVLAVGVMRRVPKLWSLSLMMLSCILFIGLLSCSIWPQTNGYHVRYYLVFVIAFASGIGYVVAHLFNPLIWGSARGQISLIFILGLEIFLGLHGISSDFAGITGTVWRARSHAVANEVLAQKVQLIIGDYWDVWPAVYESVRISPSNLDPPRAIYGAAFRGYVLRRQIQRIADGEAGIRAICFLQTQEACVKAAGDFLHLKIELMPGSVQEVNVDNSQMLLMDLKSEHWN
jgi:hypothetical protein